jgi:hypothetical protein
MLVGFGPGASDAIKQTLIATSYIKPFLKRILMRLASRFV